MQHPAEPERNDQKPETPAEMAELIAQAQRLQAEFENYQKRVEKERARLREYAHGQIFAELLPLMDSFEQALQQTPDAGVKALAEQLKKVFAAHHVQGMESIGKPFNPEYQECLTRTHDPEKPDHAVTVEHQKGYIMGGIVLRTAKVTVNTHDAPRPEEPHDEN